MQNFSQKVKEETIRQLYIKINVAQIELAKLQYLNDKDDDYWDCYLDIRVCIDELEQYVSQLESMIGLDVNGERPIFRSINQLYEYLFEAHDEITSPLREGDLITIATTLAEPHRYKITKIDWKEKKVNFFQED